MSGIAGIWNLDGCPIDAALLQRMANAAAHRGPDGIRYWVNGNIGLAHLALSSTPESLRETQPSANRASTCWLTAQARIDNRGELIRTLASKGSPLEDPTDAELILAAYDLWGEACAEKLLGDYAFAIWDAPRHQLFAARDPFGCRPFYYHQSPTRFAWASEVKQLLVDPNVERTLNARVLGAYLLVHGQPQDESFYQAVRQLPRGHALRLNGSGLRVWQHSDLLPEREIRYRRSEEYADHFRELLFDAVRVRLRSVKPVFISLSGGIDSSALTAVAAHLARAEPGTPPVHAIHVTLDEFPEDDEQRFARPLVEHCGIPAVWLPGNGFWPFRDYPQHPPDPDDPDIGYFSYWNRKLLREAAERGAGVFLNGLWGDPIVQGSVFSFADLLARLHLGEWLRGIREFRYQRGKPYRPWRRLIMEYSLRPLAPAWMIALWDRLRHQEPNALPAWIEPEFARRIGLADLIRSPSYSGHVKSQARQAIYTEIVADIAPRSAVKFEQWALQAAIDYRPPFTDVRLIRFALAVPPEPWFRNGIEKVLLREALGDLLPSIIRDRTLIIAPNTLVERGVREREVGKIRSLAPCPQLTQLGAVNSKRAVELFERCVRGERPLDHLLMWTVTTEMWLQQEYVSLA